MYDWLMYHCYCNFHIYISYGCQVDKVVVSSDPTRVILSFRNSSLHSNSRRGTECSLWLSGGWRPLLSWFESWQQLESWLLTTMFFSIYVHEPVNYEKGKQYTLMGLYLWCIFQSMTSLLCGSLYEGYDFVNKFEVTDSSKESVCGPVCNVLTLVQI